MAGLPPPAAIRTGDRSDSSIIDARPKRRYRWDIARNRFQEIAVNLEDNLQATGQNFPQHIDGPVSSASLINNVWLV